MERVSTYTGKALEITYDRRRCIHAGECGRGSGQLFDASVDPWCNPDAVDAETAVAVVLRCPSGALSVRRLDGGAIPSPARTGNVVTVYPNGPLYVQGELEIEGLAGSDAVAGAAVGGRVALCRCGASKNKPLCDGSHTSAGFEDAGPVASDPEPVELAAGVLSILPAKNGPLVLNGPLSVRAASGREAFRGEKTALCRCGASANKPFCDGTHAKTGFTAD